jgi:hypothetical protein
MKPFKAWAIVNNHGQLPTICLQAEMKQHWQYLVFKTRKDIPKSMTLKTDKVVLVEIRAVEQRPLPPTKAKHHYCR